MRLPQGRLVMPRRRIFCTQVVLDHYQTGPSRKYRVIDGILVEQGVHGADSLCDMASTGRVSPTGGDESG